MLLINLFFCPGTWTPVEPALGRPSLKSALGRFPILWWSKQREEIKGKIFLFFFSFFFSQSPFSQWLWQIRCLSYEITWLQLSWKGFPHQTLGLVWEVCQHLSWPLCQHWVCVFEYSEYFFSPRKCPLVVPKGYTGGKTARVRALHASSVMM